MIETSVVVLIVAACAAYWGRKLRRRPVAVRPSACGACKACRGDGCH